MTAPEKLPIEAIPQNNLPAIQRPQSQAVSIFADKEAFAMAVQAAGFFSNSDMVPPAYRKTDKNGKVNPKAESNCLVAIEASTQLGISPLTVMQNLSVIEGKPAWDAKFLTAMVNRSGQFTSLRYEFEEEAEPREMECTVTRWEENRATGRNEKKTHTTKYTLKNKTCRAYATDKSDGKVVKGAPVSMEMAVKEGWYGKNGSKWQTMPDTMLMYRAAAFFSRAYTPEATMGYPERHEVEDIQPDMVDVTPKPDAPDAPAPDKKPTPAAKEKPKAEDKPAKADDKKQEVIPPAKQAAATEKKPATNFAFKE